MLKHEVYKATFLHKIILYLGTNIKQNKPKRGVVGSYYKRVNNYILSYKQ